MWFYIIYFYVSLQGLPAINKQVQRVSAPNTSFLAQLKLNHHLIFHLNFILITKYNTDYVFEPYLSVIIFFNLNNFSFYTKKEIS